MTLGEIEALIGDAGDGWYRWDEGLAEEIPGLGTVTCVKSGGGEGQGDAYWLVFNVVDTAGSVRWFRMDGYYASYDGGYYDGPFSEVKPVERMVTFYE